MSANKLTGRRNLNRDLLSVIKIRTMSFTDLANVMAIETRVYPHPWTLGIFRDCLRVGHHAWVIELNKDIIGYGIVMLSPGEAHILNICVRPDYQGWGLGRHFLQYLLRKSSCQGVDMILLEVRRSNQLAQQLYQSEGFHELGVRKAYYPADNNGREDAIILARYFPGAKII